MSEEYGLKFVVNGEDYDKIKKSLNEQIEDLQQKVEQLESIRKEVEYCLETRKYYANDSACVDDIEYILNKGSEE